MNDKGNVISLTFFCLVIISVVAGGERGQEYLFCTFKMQAK